MDMKSWFEQTLESKTKKPMPLLFHPGAQLIGSDVPQILNNSDLQRDCAMALAERYNTAISFGAMDLSVEAEAFGCETIISPSGIPIVKQSIVSFDQTDIIKLRTPSVDSGRVPIFIDGIQKIKNAISDRPVFAQVIGPFSLVGQLAGQEATMIATIESPDLLEELLIKTTFFITQYIKALRNAGADGVLIAEPSAGLLSPSLNAEFSCPYIEAIVTAVQTNSFLTMYHNCGPGVSMQLCNILDCGCKIFHFGECVDLDDIKRHIPETVIFAGNISPIDQLVNGTPESVKQTANEVLEKCNGLNNFLLSSGCDIPHNAKLENIDAMFC